MRVNRRHFLQSSAMGFALVALPAVARASPAPSRDHEHGNPLRCFGYNQVTVTSAPHRAQQEQTHEILMGMNEDSLLRPFRLAAGLPAPGKDLGGWYSTDTFGPETFGQWVSALARYHAATGDSASRDKALRLIRGMAQGFRPSTPNIFSIKSNSSYFYDKIICGLVDCHSLAHASDALAIATSVTEAALPTLPGRALDRPTMGTGDGAESYTVPENQFLMWQGGGAERHLTMARDYLHNSFFDALAAGKNELPERHAYSHVNALCSAAKAYLVLGEQRYLDAARNGFAFVEQQSFATGGWGPGEGFLPKAAKHLPGLNAEMPANETLADSMLQGSEVSFAHSHFETPCGSYAHFKLTRYLLRITKNGHYGDSMERIMYNAVLGALPMNKMGNAFYHSNYDPMARKAYFDGYNHFAEDEWPCCSGTLPQIANDYGISAYFHDHQGIFVNLYIPSAVHWQVGKIPAKLTQHGDFPLSDKVDFLVNLAEPTRFSLHLRIPAWTKAAALRVNGKPLALTLSEGRFATVTRLWQDGDRLELALPMTLELKPVDDRHPDLVALTYGPMVLFGIGELPKLTRANLLSVKQAGNGASEWWFENTKFLPWWVIKNETYTTYFDVS